MSQVDLHIHSTASDGRYSPAEIVRQAARKGLKIISLTDHDSVDGIKPALEAAKDYPQLQVIPGIEISTFVTQGEVHVLGYFIDYTHPELLAVLNRMRSSRQEQAQGIIARLREMGMDIEWSRVREIAGDGSIGRPHIAQALLEKGYISSIKEAFDKYISWGGPAYIERDKVTPEEATRLILRINGLPVLAHPLTSELPETLIAELKGTGLVGIEVYYKDYTADQIRYLNQLARKHQLLATGGTDYHGLDANTEVMMGGTEVPLEAAKQLIDRASRPVPNQEVSP